MDDENKNLIDDAEEAAVGMEEIDNFDFERAAMLMGVMEKCANIGVKSTSIGGLAAAALNEMNEEAKAIARRRTEALADLERRVAMARAEKQAEREAEEAKTVVAPAETVDPDAVKARPVASKTATIADNNARRL